MISSSRTSFSSSSSVGRVMHAFLLVVFMAFSPFAQQDPTILLGGGGDASAVAGLPHDIDEEIQQPLDLDNEAVPRRSLLGKTKKGGYSSGGGKYGGKSYGGSKSKKGYGGKSKKGYGGKSKKSYGGKSKGYGGGYKSKKKSYGGKGKGGY